MTDSMMSPGRKSPKVGGPQDLLPELIYLSPVMSEENFTLANVKDPFVEIELEAVSHLVN